MSKTQVSWRGFSLIELLIVVSVIGVLVGMLLPALKLVNEAVARSQCENNLRQLGTAFHAYHDVWGTFPLDQEMPSRDTTSVPPLYAAGFCAVNAGYVSIPYKENAYVGGTLVDHKYTHSNFYIDLLPYLEQDSQYQEICRLRRDLSDNAPAELAMTPPFGPLPPFPPGMVWDTPATIAYQDRAYAYRNPQVKPVEQYVCPSRRTTDELPAFDYASGMHPHLYSVQVYGANYYPVPADSSWTNKYSILGGIYIPAVSLTDVASHDGASCTLLLAHKGVSTRTDALEAVTINASLGLASTSWASTDHDSSPNHYEGPVYFDYQGKYLAHHKRYPGQFFSDSVATKVGTWETNFLSSPHSSMSALAADGSVRRFSFNLSVAQVGSLWAWNDDAASDIEN